MPSIGIPFIVMPSMVMPSIDIPQIFESINLIVRGDVLVQCKQFQWLCNSSALSKVAGTASGSVCLLIINKQLYDT